jgi:hypothetical protein
MLSVQLRDSRDSSVGIATGYRVNGRGSIFILHSINTSSEAHPASCPVGTGGSLPEGKAAGAWRWQLRLVPSSRTVELYLLSPKYFQGLALNRLKHRDNFTFLQLQE